MTILEFLRTAEINQLCNFIRALLSGCECCGDCPLECISTLEFDNEPYYECTNDCIMKFLDSEMKKGWNE